MTTLVIVLVPFVSLAVTLALLERAFELGVRHGVISTMSAYRKNPEAFKAISDKK